MTADRRCAVPGCRRLVKGSGRGRPRRFCELHSPKRTPRRVAVPVVRELRGRLGDHVAEWLEEHLPSPSDYDSPLRLTHPERDFISAWFEHADDGTFRFHRAAIIGPKGTIKSFLGAVLSIAELAGPVLPGGKRHPRPEVQLAALSLTQASMNVYGQAWALLTPEVAKRLDLDVGRLRIYTKDRPGSLLAVTASAGAREGQRVSFGVMDESHLWTRENRGHDVAAAMRRNAAKTAGRTLECSNAPLLGDGSVAEMTLSQTDEEGLLLVYPQPSTIPEQGASDDELRGLLAEMYEWCDWVSIDRLLTEIRDPATRWSDALRYFLNVSGSAEDAFLAAEAWDGLPIHEGIAPGARVGIGFDGSQIHDGTALVACDEEGRLEIAGLWTSEGEIDWRVPRSEVADVLEGVFADYQVARLMADPFYWQSELEDWSRRWPGIVISSPTNRPTSMARQLDRFRISVGEKRLQRPAEDGALRAHVLNARLRRMGGRYTLEKAAPGRLIDACVAAVLAHDAIASVGPAPLRDRSPAFVV